MSNLITVNDYINSGVNISDDISTSEITNCINTIEQFYIKYKIGDVNYINLLQNPTTGDNRILLNGGIIDNKMYAGLKYAEYHLVYAYHLINPYRITRFGTVLKSSEYSDNAKSVNIEDLQNTARVHWNIGETAVKEVMRYYQLDDTQNDNNNLFETLLY